MGIYHSHGTIWIILAFIILCRPIITPEPCIDGYTSFIILNKRRPQTYHHLEIREINEQARSILNSIL